MTDIIPRKTMLRAIAAGSLGQAFEIYDFLVFGFFAAQIGKAFFPSKDPLLSLLASLATFGSGFLMRPLGAVILGRYADRVGRRAMLALAIGLMAIATGLISLIPSYSAIGVSAPILLVCCRLAQGFSIGGEWGGAATFLSEYSPAGRRGLWSSFQSAFGGAGSIFALLTAASLSFALNKVDLAAWGWRLPFVIGCLLAPIGFYFRSRLTETPVFLRARALAATSVASVSERRLSPYLGKMVKAGGVVVLSITLQYLFVVFLPGFATSALKMDPSACLLATLVGVTLYVLLTPVVGALSDRVGRKAPLLASCLCTLLFSYPLFAALVAHPSFGALLTLQVFGGVVQGLVAGVITATLSELFPTAVRAMALSISYAATSTIFGGFAPFIATYLVTVTGNALAPSFYLIGTACLSLAAILTLDLIPPGAELDE